MSIVSYILEGGVGFGRRTGWGMQYRAAEEAGKRRRKRAACIGGRVRHVTAEEGGM